MTVSLFLGMERERSEGGTLCLGWMDGWMVVTGHVITIHKEPCVVFVPMAGRQANTECFRLRAEKARTGGKETQYGYHMGPVPTIGPSVVWVEQGVLWVKYINFKKGLNGTLDRVNLLGLMEFFTFFVLSQFFKVNKRKAMNVM